MGAILDILNEAAKLEKEYKWLEASEAYRQVLKEVDEGDYFRRGEVQEKIGYSLRRAAFQADSRDTFRERLQHTIEAYEQAYGLYEKLTDEQGTPWMLRCKAITKDLSYWLASNPHEKKKLLDECLELEEKALSGFLDGGDKLEYGRTYIKLPLVHYNRYVLEWDRQNRERIFEKAIAWGENALEMLSELEDIQEIARVSCILEFYFTFFYYWHVAEPDKREQHRLKHMERLRKNVDLCEKAGDAYLVGQTHWNLGWNVTEEGTQHLRKALDCGEETRDIFLKAVSQDTLAFRINWVATGQEDPDQRLKLGEEGMAFYDKGWQNLSIMSYLFRQIGLICPPGGYSEYYYSRARWETDQGNKKEFLKKAEKDGLKALKIAEDSDIPSLIDQMCHYQSKTLQARATLEPDIEEKRGLLERAMELRERSIEIEEKLHPFSYWRIGVWYFYLALIQMEFADVEPDPKEKRRLLEDAVLNMEKSLENIHKALQYRERWDLTSHWSIISRNQNSYEVVLTRLYEVTNEPSYLRRAIEISRKAVESSIKADLMSRIAESYWKIAKNHDILGEHAEAADNYRHASEYYVKAAKKIPQLKNFYQDHANYMEAWSEIQRARHHHNEKKYGMAKENYQKAAKLHGITERWRYLSPNYLAWTRIEEAEDLSRSEQTKEARNIFQKAASLFVKTRESIQDKLKTIEAGEERKIAERLVKASDVRREYCLGRMALEEARIQDREGDHAASSRSYGNAAKKFQIVIDAQQEETDRKELRPIVYLCQAWQKMMDAEARASPTLYREAAELFIQAKEHALDQTTSLLAQAHSSFCRALEAGTEFQIIRDTSLHSAAIQHLESSAEFYLRADVKTASEYTKATQRLFDAYVYLMDAKKETDLAQRARLYRVAERILQASEDSYHKAKHPEKSELVHRILEGVKEEREIAISLTEVLHAPLMASTTTSFSTPNPTYEQAVGLERFEYADVQANLTVRKKQMRVGEDVDLQIALINAGKAPAQLIKINEIIPTGFEVRRVPNICRVEDNYLDMRGRELSPLKTEELRLVLRPMNTGTFHLNPMILYLDESGRYKSQEPEPATLEVRGRKGPPI